MLKRAAVILGVSVLLSSCRSGAIQTTDTPAITTLSLVTTSATAPLARELIQTYVRSDALFVIRITETSWTGLADQLAADESIYGMTTFLPENSGLWAAAIGEDGIAIITHRDLDISKLTARQLRDIFSGTVQNWSEVGGADLPLIVVSNQEGADTRLAFERMVMGSYLITPAARLAPTSGSMIDIVATTPGAIGYVSFGLVDRRIKVVPVAATESDPPLAPSLQTIEDKTYPLRTPILLVGRKAPDPDTLTYEFFIWIQQGDGQRIIGQHYVPLSAD